jgi:hypothetical protein
MSGWYADATGDDPEDTPGDPADSWHDPGPANPADVAGLAWFGSNYHVGPSVRSEPKAQEA